MPADGFLVDEGENVAGELGVEVGGYLHTPLHEVGVAVPLHDLHSVFLLVAAYVACHAHTFGKYLQQFVVEPVYGAPQLVDAVSCNSRAPVIESGDYFFQFLGSHLLRTVAERPVGIAVRFDHQSAEVHVKGLLRKGNHQPAFPGTL